MNRRHFIKAIAACAAVPLLPPGKEWAEETGWMDMGTANTETTRKSFVMAHIGGPCEYWASREDGAYDVYVMSYYPPDGKWHAMVGDGITPDRVEHYDPLTIKIPMTPPRKE